MRICVGAALFTLVASYLGAIHGLGDSLAVFRAWIAYGTIAVGVVALLARLWWMGAGATLAALAALLHIASFGQFHTPTPVADADLVVYTKNLGAGRTDWAAFSADIAASGADVIVLQEVTQARMAELPILLPDHPYQHICNFSGWSAMAVISRWPVSNGGCTEHRSLAYATVDAPSGPVFVASIHQVWPYPYEQAALLPDILAAIPQSPTRQVTAGDFNMVPWGHSVSAIADAGGTTRIGPVFPTFEVRGVEMMIDHVLSDGRGTLTRSAQMGSDHYGLIARIAWD